MGVVLGQGSRSGMVIWELHTHICGQLVHCRTCYQKYQMRKTATWVGRGGGGSLGWTLHSTALSAWSPQMWWEEVDRDL